DAFVENVLAKGLIERARLEITDAVRKGADARQDDVTRLTQFGGLAGDHWRTPALLDGSDHRVDVAHAVIDYSDTLYRARETTPWELAPCASSMAWVSTLS